MGLIEFIITLSTGEFSTTPGGGDDWVVQDGAWDDEGFWDDEETWID